MKFLNHTYTGNQSEATQGFKKTGLDDTHFLLAGGGSTPTNLWATNAQLGNYMPTTHPANSITTLNITNWNNYFPYIVDGAIAPNELGVQKLRFGFTSWNNNSTSPYADFIHFGGYAATSGGNQNLLLINKGSFGIRQYQATSQSTTPYANFVDYWHSGNFNPSNYYTKAESLGLFVGLTGVQTIADTKTFTASPIVPNPTLANHAVNKSWVEGQGYINAGLNIDVSDEDGELRINPIEIFFDGSGTKKFDGIEHPHRLVYIILGDNASGLSLENLQPKQRIVIFNLTGTTISIKEDIASSSFSLSAYYKISAYKIHDSYYSANTAIFYDKAELSIW